MRALLASGHEFTRADAPNKGSTEGLGEQGKVSGHEFTRAERRAVSFRL